MADFDELFRETGTNIESGIEFYRRTFKLNIDGNAFTALRVAFRIEKTLKPSPNQAELRIWNLNADSRKAFTKDLLVSLEAGYDLAQYQVFLGNLAKVDHFRDVADWVTKARIGDGTKEIKAARVNKNWKPGSKPADIVKDLAKNFTDTIQAKGFDVRIAAGNAVDKAKKGDTKGALEDFSRGYVAVGATFDELVKMGNNLGYDVSIQDKEVTWLAADETTGNTDVLLNSDTGLVGSPEQAEGEIVKARSLLNGELSPGRGVKLESDNFDGRYRVQKVVLIGDTHGPEWFSELELKRVG